MKPRLSAKVRTLTALYLSSSLTLAAFPGSCKIVTSDENDTPSKEAFEYDSIVPPEEWDTLPVWSHSGSSMAVVWPRESSIDSVGRLTRVLVKPDEVWSGKLRFAGKEIAQGKNKSPFEHRRTLFLDGQTFARTNVSSPSDFWRAYWAPDDQKVALEGPYGITVASARDNEVVVLSNFDKAWIHATNVAWSPDSQFVARPMLSGIEIIDIETNKKFAVDLKKAASSTLAWSPDGSLISILSHSTRYSDLTTDLTVIDFKTKQVVFEKSSPHGIRSAGWSPPLDGNSTFAFVDEAINLKTADLKHDIAVLPFKTIIGTGSLEWSPDGRHFATAGNNNQLRIYDTASQKLQATIEAEKNGLYRFLWSRNGERIAVFDDDYLAVFDSKTGALLSAQKIDHIGDAAWAPDGKYIAVQQTISNIKMIPIESQYPGSLTVNAKVDNPWKNQAEMHSLDDFINELARIVPANFISIFKASKEEKLDDYRHGFCRIGFGSFLRNRWRLSRNSPVTEYFNGLGIKDSVSMSDIIITSSWRRFNDRPLELEAQLAEARLSEHRELDPIIQDVNLTDEFIDALQLKKRRQTRATVIYIHSKNSVVHCRGIEKRLENLYRPDQVQVINIEVDDHTWESNRQLNALRKLVDNQLTLNSGGLPQTLIIQDNRVLKLRFNGSSGYGEDELNQDLDKNIVDALTWP